MNHQVYASFASTLLGIFAVYGVIGNIFNVRELAKFPERGEWPFNQRYTIYVMLAVNFFLIVAGFLGLFALIRNKNYLYFWSAFILLGSFAVQLLHGVACTKTSFDDMTKEIFSTFKSHSQDPHFTTWLSDFQWQYDCCGIVNYIDWSGPLAKKTSKFAVPDSCCNRKIRVPIPSCGKGLLAPNVSVDTAKSVINTVGCGQKISQIFQNEIRTKGYVMLAVAFLALVSGIILFVCQKEFGEVTCRANRIQTNHRRIRRLGRSQNQFEGTFNSQQQQQQQQSINSELDMNANSQYNSTAIHKPPTGRGGGRAKEDSSKNVSINRELAQKTNFKHYRVNQNQKHKYGPIIQRHPGQTSRNNNDFMRTKLEMLMHPIETHSTSSATPNPSDLFPFYGHETSSSDCFQPSSKFDGCSASAESKIAHYNSLPLFSSSFGNVVTFPDGRVETLYHYNTSHLHAQNMRRRHSQRPKVSTFVEGKYPSLTIASTLATIHEENESVKSGNSQTSSTGPTTASSSPRSMSKTTSSHNNQLVNIIQVVTDPHGDMDIESPSSPTIEPDNGQMSNSTEEGGINSNVHDSNTNLPELKSTKNFGRRLGPLSKIPSRCLDPVAVVASGKCIRVTRKGSSFVTTQEVLVSKP